jgi:hypothetical protein
MLGTNWATDLIACHPCPRATGWRPGRDARGGRLLAGTVEELTRLVAKPSVALEMLVLRQKLSG